MSNLTQQEINSLFARANKGDVTVLQDPNVSKVKNLYGETPLHWATEKLVGALQHPDVAKVKDISGNTPLHWAARNFKEVLQHPDVSKVKNAWGKTPKDLYEDKRTGRRSEEI